MYLAICILRVRCNKYGVKLFVKAPNSANKITKTLNPHIYYNNNNNNELRKKNAAMIEAKIKTVISIK